MNHLGFLWELMGKLGAPIFAATLVACLLAAELSVLHLVLMVAGLGLMALGHWREHHSDRRSPDV